MLGFYQYHQKWSSVPLTRKAKHWQEHQKTVDLKSKTTILQVWYSCIIFLHDHNMKVPCVPFYGGHKHMTWRLLSLSDMGAVPKNSTPGKLTLCLWHNIWQLFWKKATKSGKCTNVNLLLLTFITAEASYFSQTHDCTFKYICAWFVFYFLCFT